MNCLQNISLEYNQDFNLANQNNIYAASKTSIEHVTNYLSK